MRMSVKLGLTALAASLLLAAAVGSASARNLSTSNQNIRATWSSLEFNAAEFVIIRCPVTLEGSFHTRTIAKVRGALIGAVTRADLNQSRCTNGSGAPFNGSERYNGTTSPQTLPWHMTYEGFRGILPNITSLEILLQRFRFGLRDSSSLCTGQYGRAEDNISAAATRGATGAITTLTPIEGANRASLIRQDGGLFCPGTGSLQGPGQTFLLGNTTRISITLI